MVVGVCVCGGEIWWGGEGEKGSSIMHNTLFSQILMDLKKILFV